MSSTPHTLADCIGQSKCEYRRLGKSGLCVSIPILGAMSLGKPVDWFPWVQNEQESALLLKAAYDRGLNTFDTAGGYNNGWSERVIGQALREHQIPRDRIIICTKVFFTAAEEVGVNPFAQHAELVKTKQYVNRAGLSRQAIFNQVEESLERLGTSYIDLLQIHRFDSETPIEETMQALNDLVRDGRVRYIGASSMWTYQFAMMQACAERNGWTRFVSMQNYYNLLYREEEREMNKYCNETGVALIPWAPLCRGHLARPATSYGSTERSAGEQKQNPIGLIGPDLEIVQRVEEIAKGHGWSMADVAIAWINKRVTSPIIGLSDVKRLEEMTETSQKNLTDEEMRYLEELYEPKNVEGHM